MMVAYGKCKYGLTPYQGLCHVTPACLRRLDGIKLI